MRLNDWDWRREQEEACRLFDHFQAEYGTKIFENKEDIKMDLNQLTDNKQAADAQRRAIMNQLKVGDRVCTSINMTIPMEIFAFDYAHLRVGLTNRISFEGYEKVSRLWIDPLTITDPILNNKVSYTTYYRGGFTQRYIPSPKKIIVNEDAKITVVMWDDNTKTIVKCSEADQYDPYAAYCAAFAKKCYGTNSQLKKTIENLTVIQEKKKKDKPTAPLLPSMEEAVKNFCDTAKKYFGTD